MTTGMNQRQVRVIDPVLSTVAQGYSNNAFVGRYLFPRVNVAVSGGQIIKFGKESFRKYNLRRAPGGPTPRINYGYAGEPFALFQDSVEATVPREHSRDAQVAMPGIDLGRNAVTFAMNTITKSLEDEQASLATDAAKYDANHKVTLSGADKWSADAGRPSADISAAKEAIRATTGQRPNVCILSPSAYAAAQNNPSIQDRFKYSSSEVITAQMLAALWEIPIVAVAEAITALDDDTFADIWGNNVVLGYAPQQPSGQGEPSYGYTYTMEGHPMVETPYWDANAKSWIYGVTMERAPVMTSMLSGFLIQNPA